MTTVAAVELSSRFGLGIALGANNAAAGHGTADVDGMQLKRKRRPRTLAAANAAQEVYGRSRSRCGKDVRTRRRKSRLLIGGFGNSSTPEVMAATSSPKVQGISLIQAARDDLLDVVKTNVDCYRAQIDDADDDGFTALHYAARYNRLTVAEILVNSGAAVNAKQSPDEATALHMACRYNSTAVTQLLLTRGAAVNATDVRGKTPLHYATRRGHELVIKMLISVSSCNVNAADNDQTTPLIMAAIQGNSFICESLISRGADIERRDMNEMSALMWAAAEGHAQVVKLLLKAALRRGAFGQKNYIRARDKDGNTALHLAVQNGSLEVVNILLASGADVNCTKNNLSTPLHVAASYGFLDIAKVLVVNGAEIDCRDIEQQTPIHRAAIYNMVEILEYLFKKGGNLNVKDKRNTQPLHGACWKGQTDAVEFLLKNGANITECDSSLKTALHWAVRFGHFETLQILLKHGGKLVLDYTDKNDQTVLHYAAYTGNVLVLKTLLELGARPDAKDQEERSALHLAAERDNVSCVEALILASNRETNDDDVDGRTPLLSACINGHHQTVVMLLHLGGDITVRDDERCTALMLAAAQGHTQVMKILLDHQAAVNDCDKVKNTALHYACAGGHVKAVELLLERKADVTLKNTYNATPLDQAIDNLHHDVVVAMLKNKSTCHACLSVRNSQGKNAMDRLIARLPDAATVVLDHSIDRAVRDDEERSVIMTFDYQYIDPGPGDPASVPNRYFALNTMIQYEREALLSHPLCQNLLYRKWCRFGRTIFFVNMMIYLGYLACLTSFTILERPNLTTTIRRIRNTTNLPREPNDFEIEDYLPDKETRGIMIDVFNKMLYGFIGLFFIREMLKIFSQKCKYLFSVYNIIVWVLIVTTMIFTHSFGPERHLFQWQAGWIAMFFAWINFIMYLRRIDKLGIYVIMFVNILVSLLKVILMLLMFVFAFASSFFFIFQDVKMYRLENVVLSVIVMTIGEFQLNDVILAKSLLPFDIDLRILLVVFCFLMTIVVINLTIGTAVGDIDNTHRTAYLKKIGLQVDLTYDIENNMPTFIQRAVHEKRIIIKPTEGATSGIQKVAWNLFARTGIVQFIHGGAKDKVTSKLENVTDNVRTQQSSIQAMQTMLQQRSKLLHQIAVRLDATSSRDSSPLPADAAAASAHHNLPHRQFSTDGSLRDHILPQHHPTHRPSPSPQPQDRHVIELSSRQRSAAASASAVSSTAIHPTVRARAAAAAVATAASDGDSLGCDVNSSSAEAETPSSAKFEREMGLHMRTQRSPVLDLLEDDSLPSTDV